MLKRIFVNLKRFEVPRRLGGICPMEDPGDWIERVLDTCLHLGMGELTGVEIVFFLPEALIISAARMLAQADPRRAGSLSLGCQGVFREDIEVGGNFGAFTTNLPATAAKNLGCDWVLIGHSEERRNIQGIIEQFEPLIATDVSLASKTSETVKAILRQEAGMALRAGLKVLFCVGETAQEQGGGGTSTRESRTHSVLSAQLLQGLPERPASEIERGVIIAYEPVWAIGPGKTPPGADYIGHIAGFIKNLLCENCRVRLDVVYGGGLREENAVAIAGQTLLDGGLVGLTRFAGQIGFDPTEFWRIVEQCLGVWGQK